MIEAIIAWWLILGVCVFLLVMIMIASIDTTLYESVEDYVRSSKDPAVHRAWANSPRLYVAGIVIGTILLWPFSLWVICVRRN